MSPEEKNPEGNEMGQFEDSDSINAGESSDQGDVEMAELAEPTVGDDLTPMSDVDASLNDVLGQANSTFGGNVVAPPSINKSLQNLSANGGAIGALVLGVWCLVGSFVTNWSMINGILGIPLAIWGMSSHKKWMSWAGLILCVIGIFLCLIEANQLLNTYFEVKEEIENPQGF